MKQVKAYAKVETIEGIGSAERLHPLQRAFMTYASVQCGFCSPGFIMSAKGLLMRNPDPTREEVREWFTRHGNVCRCTGYKPIVDAVMEAAAVMARGKGDGGHHLYPAGGRSAVRFGFPEAHGAFPGTRDMRLRGRHFREDAGRHAASGGCSGETGTCPDTALDTAEAQAMPGVVNVVTAKDVKGTNRLVAPQGTVHSLCDGLDRPVICDGVVRRYGDVVAVVAATAGTRRGPLRNGSGWNTSRFPPS